MIRQLIISVVLLLLLSFLPSCRKRDFTQIEGQVVEKGSNRPIAGASVIFSQCVPGDGTFSPSVCLDVATVLTDANGKFIFTKEDDDADRYKVRAEKLNYGKAVEVYELADAGKKTKNIKLTLPAYAWIKFHVKNVNPFDDNDLIVAPGSSGADLNYRFWGKFTDTTYIDKGYGGNQKNSIKWYVTKNGVLKAYNDSIFVKGLDTAFYEIKY